MQVRELHAGCEVALIVQVRGSEPRRDGRGGWVELVLGDRTGTVAAIVPDGLGVDEELCRPGRLVHVTGRFERQGRNGGRLVVQTIAAAGDEGGTDPHRVDGPARAPAQMHEDLRELIATVQDLHLRRLLDAILGDGSGTGAWFAQAPAAKHYHQAYRHGLLEHCLTVAQAVSAISAIFPGIDRDVAVTGALLHDIGKLDAYELSADAIAMSDDGRLYGEIALGYYRVRSVTEQLDGFPPELAHAVLHIILSHHGSLEHGSPVIPCTREATLVHMIDNLGGRLGSFDRVQRTLPAGERWAAYDKGIGGGAYFAPPAVVERRAA